MYHSGMFYIEETTLRDRETETDRETERNKQFQTWPTGSLHRDEFTTNSIQYN